MANLKAAKKSLRSDVRKREYNDRRRRTMKASIKEVEDLVSGKDQEKAKAILPKAYKAIDKAAKNGVIKKNTAARKKSRLARLIGTK